MVDESASGSTSRRSWRRWGLAIVLVAFFGYLLWQVVNPYRGQAYEEVPHGDHTHYVPRDRDTDVPISRFPTRPPGEGERITPDGNIVPER